MTIREKDIKNEVVKEVNGYEIIRSESKMFDGITQEYKGHRKVYYDVCKDEDLYESFKTLAAAIAYCEAN